jgi:hypothetical protein
VKHALQFETSDFGLESLRVGIDVARGTFIALALGELEELGGVGDALGGAVDLDRVGGQRARSRPSSCARSGLVQTAGSSSSRLTSSRRSFLWSYSKKPP